MMRSSSCCLSDRPLATECSNAERLQSAARDLRIIHAAGLHCESIASVGSAQHRFVSRRRTTDTGAPGSQVF